MCNEGIKWFCYWFYFVKDKEKIEINDYFFLVFDKRVGIVRRFFIGEFKNKDIVN